MGIKILSQPLMERAIKTAGLEDFGGNTFEQGLEALIGSLNSDLNLNEGTAGYFQQLITQILINRLQVTQLIKDHPEIADEEIKAPIFIVGLPRTGTTITHTLMAQDPLSRFLRNFESAGAVCPPPPLMPNVPDPRIQAGHDAMEALFSMGPDLRGINGINFMAQGTAECQNLMAHEFVHLGWSAGSSLFGHGNWVGDCDMSQAYAWHKRLLQMFQWKRPNDRWVLKAPIHLFGLESLLETYPDARIVFTHRDPVDAMMSGISMASHWTRLTTGKADIPAIAHWYPALWAKGLERALGVRDKLKEAQVFDLFHTDLSQDPVGSIMGIYKHFNISFSRIFQRRMQVWLRDNPRSKFGNHVYDSTKLGLDREQEKARFCFYLDRFNLAGGE
ncbi:MAG: sulfotransferase [Desulfobacter sp.]|nr:MAG: sulfotransferase [Desulfobacter sp.]